MDCHDARCRQNGGLSAPDHSPPVLINDMPGLQRLRFEGLLIERRHSDRVFSGSGGAVRAGDGWRPGADRDDTSSDRDWLSLVARQPGTGSTAARDRTAGGEHGRPDSANIGSSDGSPLGGYRPVTRWERTVDAVISAWNRLVAYTLPSRQDSDALIERLDQTEQALRKIEARDRD